MISIPHYVKKNNHKVPVEYLNQENLFAINTSKINLAVITWISSIRRKFFFFISLKVIRQNSFYTEITNVSKC